MANNMSPPHDLEYVQSLTLGSFQFGESAFETIGDINLNAHHGSIFGGSFGDFYLFQTQLRMKRKICILG